MNPWKMRFAGVTPGIIDGEHLERLGRAWLLYFYLIMRQTPGSQGWVNYGHPIPDAQIRREIPNPLAQRALERHRARLKREGYIDARIMRHGRTVVGVVYRILDQKKWPAQLSLFPRGNLVEMKRSEDLVESRRTPPAFAGSIPEPRSISPSALERKAARLEQEIKALLETHAGSLVFPAHAEDKIRDLARELELTRYAARQLETRKAG